MDRNTLENYFHHETPLGDAGEDFQLSGFMHNSSESSCYSLWILAKDSGDEEPGNELCIAEPRGGLNSNAWITL